MNTQARTATEGPFRWCLTLPSLALLAWLPILGERGPGAGRGNESADAMLSALVAFGLPLLLFGVFSSFPEASWSAEQRALTRYGLDRRPAALRQLALRSVALWFFASLFAGLAVWMARGAGDPRLASDLRASLGAVALGSWALVAWFAFATSWAGKKGLWLALAVTWTLGHVPAVVAAAVPVGHLRHLLGLGVALPFPQWISALALGLIGFPLLGAAIWRLPR